MVKKRFTGQEGPVSIPEPYRYQPSSPPRHRERWRQKPFFFFAFHTHREQISTVSSIIPKDYAHPKRRGGKAAKKALGLLAGVTFVRQGTLKVEQENQSCPQPRLLLAPATPFITQVGFHTLTPLHSEIGLLKDLGCCEFPRHCFNWWGGNKNTLKFHLAVKSDLEVAPYRSRVVLIPRSTTRSTGGEGGSPPWNR